MSITTRIQANPEISTNNSAYITELVDRGKQYIVEYCNLPRYPALAQGYSKSAVTPSTDLTSISTNAFWISVNGGDFKEAIITLSRCNTGSNTAAEFQTVVRALDADNGFGEVTVAYDSTSSAEYYTFTSGRYGEGSAVVITFNEDYKQVAQNAKLSLDYGGTEFVGGAQDDELDNACVMVVEAMYNKMGAEGFQSISLLGGLSFSDYEIAPRTLSILNARRRLW